MPLEEYAGQVFQSLGILDDGARFFRRQDGENDEEIDRIGVLPAAGGGVIQAFGVECKHARGRWIFPPASPYAWQTSRVATFQSHPRHPFDGLGPVEASRFYGKGVALYLSQPGASASKEKWEVDTNKIPNAIRQAALGTMDYFATRLANFIVSGPSNIQMAFHPIVLTTADLYVLPPGTTHHAIEGATEDLNDVAQKVPSVELAFRSQPYMQAALWHSFNRELAEQSQAFNWRPKGSIPDAARTLFREHCAGQPSRCSVVHDTDFKQFLQAKIAEGAALFAPTHVQGD
ncbi:MAG: hypothetical protein QOE90_3318 [Thermoplasmata archaeon]|nr:hypothetical protein [Thermoplasmata archaeon]